MTKRKFPSMDLGMAMSKVRKNEASKPKPAPKQRKPRSKKAKSDTHRIFFADQHENKIHIVSTDKRIRIMLQLASQPNRKRLIGIVTKSTKTMEIKRNRTEHLMRKLNAYGFNEYILKEAKTFDTIRLSDEYSDWKIPVKYILEHGTHLNFKQQGFELQIFITLEQLQEFRINEKENRRF